jgi:hypothetical protein
VKKSQHNDLLKTCEQSNFVHTQVAAQQRYVAARMSKRYISAATWLRGCDHQCCWHGTHVRCAAMSCKGLALCCSTLALFVVLVNDAIIEAATQVCMECSALTWCAHSCKHTTTANDAPQLARSMNVSVVLDAS